MCGRRLTYVCSAFPTRGKVSPNSSNVWCVIVSCCRAPHGSPCCADSVFSAFSGRSWGGISVGAWNSNVHFKSCTFRGITDAVAAQTPGKWEFRFGAIYISGHNSSLVLDNCTFSDMRDSISIVAGPGAYVFSDNAQDTVRSHPCVTSICLHSRVIAFTGHWCVCVHAC